MAETAKQNDPPLVDVKVTNPVQYLKIWWNRIIGSEGVDFSLHVRPLTAIAISIALISVSFGLGRVSLPFSVPFFKFNTPTPISSGTNTNTPDPWKETGFTGTLQYSSNTNKYYLITTSSAEAITLSVPQNIKLEELVGKRIFANGNYNKSNRTLEVLDTKSLEILPKSPIPLPTETSSVSPSPTDTQL